MTTWWHHPTILNLAFNRRLVLRVSCILLLCIALITTLFFNAVTHAAPGVNQTIGFQGRLLDANGDIVKDGSYNMQFKIYQGGTGTAAGNPDGTLKWTETYVNNGNATGAVEVKNGFMSVNLGSNNPFGSSVDWNQDTLWLSMNIAGSSVSCSTFGTAPCAADGEMLPMKRMTSTPYSINSGMVGGKTTDQLLQLGQGTQTDATTGSSININKTGTGNLVQLQSASTDAFTINNAGSISMGSAANQSISVGTSTSGAGKSLTVKGGTAASGSNLGGGDLVLQGGAGDGTGTSGNVIVKSNGSNTAGTFQVQNTAGEAVLSVNTANKSVSIGSVSVAPIQTAGTVYTLFNNATPATLDVDVTQSLEVGTKFRTSQAGVVTGVKFYKNNSNTGTHIGNLWTADGKNLGRVTFTNETASGWQQATFATPINVVPNTTYVISYFSPTGHVSSDSNYFTSSYTSGPLTALKDGVDGPNSMFIYNATSTFPDSITPTSDNPYVDVVFQANANDTISSTGNLNLTSNGSLTVGSATQSLSLQGSTVSIGATSGGSVSIQGGDASANDSDGGNVTISGGFGKGDGNNGLVVISTPTFATNTADYNCYDSSSPVYGNDCVITDLSVNNYASVIVGLHETGKRVYLPDPAIKTAGRIFYVTSSYDSSDFTLWMNNGGAGNLVSVRAGSTVPLLWNGQDWVVANNSNIGVNYTNYIETQQTGSGSDDGNLTLLTLDKSASPPNLTDPALLGSMYYDTTIGKVQCYEADGFGTCSNSPDTFVSIAPTYANSVQNGTATGTMTNDFCSDGLNINDATAGTNICGTNETYNFYKWTATSGTAQVKSIYVTYQLPSTFKNFIAGSTSLMGRTDSANGITNYQAYKSNGAGITACGGTTAVSTGAQTLWQKGTASGTADPSACSFTAGDSIVFKVSLSSKSSGSAYASNLNFAYSSK